MSSTTGGRDYRPLACYYTDRLVAEAIVRAFVVPVAGEDDTFLEPHVGGGAFLQALYTAGLVRADNVEVQDIDPEAPGHDPKAPRCYHRKVIKVRALKALKDAVK